MHMTRQSSPVQPVSGNNDFAQWRAAAIMTLLQHAATLANEDKGDEVIFTGQGPKAQSHDQLIVQIAARQDKEAFRVLFTHFAPRLKTYLSNLGMTGERAEDLAQEAMVAVWQKAHLYRPEKAAASTWIFQIARNKFIDQMRRQKYPEVQVEDHLNELVAEDETDAPVALDRMSSRVADAMGALSEVQREVVELSFFEELSHSQIAERLDLPLGTVKSRIRIAFEVLRKVLGDYK